MPKIYTRFTVEAQTGYTTDWNILPSHIVNVMDVAPSKPSSSKLVIGASRHKRLLVFYGDHYNQTCNSNQVVSIEVEKSNHITDKQYKDPNDDNVDKQCNYQRRLQISMNTLSIDSKTNMITSTDKQESRYCVPRATDNDITGTKDVCDSIYDEQTSTILKAENSQIKRLQYNIGGSDSDIHNGDIVKLSTSGLKTPYYAATNYHINAHSVVQTQQNLPRSVADVSEESKLQAVYLSYELGADAVQNGGRGFMLSSISAGFKSVKSVCIQVKTKDLSNILNVFGIDPGASPNTAPSDNYEDPDCTDMSTNNGEWSNAAKELWLKVDTVTTAGLQLEARFVVILASDALIAQDAEQNLMPVVKIAQKHTYWNTGAYSSYCLHLDPESQLFRFYLTLSQDTVEQIVVSSDSIEIQAKHDLPAAQGQIITNTVKYPYSYTCGGDACLPEQNFGITTTKDYPISEKHCHKEGKGCGPEPTLKLYSIGMQINAFDQTQQDTIWTGAGETDVCTAYDKLTLYNLIGTIKDNAAATDNKRHLLKYMLARDKDDAGNAVRGTCASDWQNSSKTKDTLFNKKLHVTLASSSTAVTDIMPVATKCAREEAVSLTMSQSMNDLKRCKYYDEDSKTMKNAVTVQVDVESDTTFYTYEVCFSVSSVKDMIMNRDVSNDPFGNFTEETTAVSFAGNCKTMVLAMSNTYEAYSSTVGSNVEPHFGFDAAVVITNIKFELAMDSTDCKSVCTKRPDGDTSDLCKTCVQHLCTADTAGVSDAGIDRGSCTNFRSDGVAGFRAEQIIRQEMIVELWTTTHNDYDIGPNYQGDDPVEIANFIKLLSANNKWVYIKRVRSSRVPGTKTIKTTFDLYTRYKNNAEFAECPFSEAKLGVNKIDYNINFRTIRTAEKLHKLEELTDDKTYAEQFSHTASFGSWRSYNLHAHYCMTTKPQDTKLTAGKIERELFLMSSYEKQSDYGITNEQRKAKWEAQKLDKDNDEVSSTYGVKMSMAIANTQGNQLAVKYAQITRDMQTCVVPEAPYQTASMPDVGASVPYDTLPVVLCTRPYSKLSNTVGQHPFASYLNNGTLTGIGLYTDNCQFNADVTKVNQPKKFDKWLPGEWQQFLTNWLRCTKMPNSRAYDPTKNNWLAPSSTTKVNQYYLCNGGTSAQVVQCEIDFVIAASIDVVVDNFLPSLAAIKKKNMKSNMDAGYRNYSDIVSGSTRIASGYKTIQQPCDENTYSCYRRNTVGTARNEAVMASKLAWVSSQQCDETGGTNCRGNFVAEGPYGSDFTESNAAGGYKTFCNFGHSSDVSIERFFPDQTDANGDPIGNTYANHLNIQTTTDLQIEPGARQFYQKSGIRAERSSQLSTDSLDIGADYNVPGERVGLYALVVVFDVFSTIYVQGTQQNICEQATITIDTTGAQHSYNVTLTSQPKLRHPDLTKRDKIIPVNLETSKEMFTGPTKSCLDHYSDDTDCEETITSHSHTQTTEDGVLQSTCSIVVVERDDLNVPSSIEHMFRVHAGVLQMKKNSKWYVVYVGITCKDNPAIIGGRRLLAVTADDKQPTLGKRHHGVHPTVRMTSAPRTVHVRSQDIFNVHNKRDKYNKRSNSRALLSNDQNLGSVHVDSATGVYTWALNTTDTAVVVQGSNNHIHIVPGVHASVHHNVSHGHLHSQHAHSNDECDEHSRVYGYDSMTIVVMFLWLLAVAWIFCRKYVWYTNDEQNERKYGLWLFYAFTLILLFMLGMSTLMNGDSNFMNKCHGASDMQIGGLAILLAVIAFVVMKHDNWQGMLQYVPLVHYAQQEKLEQPPSSVGAPPPPPPPPPQTAYPIIQTSHAPAGKMSRELRASASSWNPLSGIIKLGRRNPTPAEEHVSLFKRHIPDSKSTNKDDFHQL
jgi:hypothetical protein